jgi:hypothetical protein
MIIPKRFKELYEKVCKALEKAEARNNKPLIAEKFKKQRRRRFKLNK